MGDHRPISVLLDEAIRHWRERRDAAASESDRKVAACYIDAYQSVRTWLGLPLLPSD